MTRYFTADLHLGHHNIIAYTNRPYNSVDEMNADLVHRWNERVAPDDEVWVVGDVAMGRLDESLAYVGQLNGTKLLIPGNHDRMFGCHGKKYAKACAQYVGAGFDEILDPVVVTTIGGMNVLVTHFPYQGDSKETHEDRYQDQRPPDRGSYLVHGHTHGLWRRNGRMVDVGVDAWGGYPVDFEEVANLFLSPNEGAKPRLPYEKVRWVKT